AENATALARSGEGLSLTQPPENEETYVFYGWYYDGRIVPEGNLFEVRQALATERSPGSQTLDTVVLYPVFGHKKPASQPLDPDRTSIILDANGGHEVANFTLPENGIWREGALVLYVEDLQVNAAVTLPTEPVYEMADPNIKFLGWAYTPTARLPDFLAGETVGVDNEEGNGYQGGGVNYLYAVWHLKSVSFRFYKVSEPDETPLAGAEFALTAPATREQGDGTQEQAAAAQEQEAETLKQEDAAQEQETAAQEQAAETLQQETGTPEQETGTPEQAAAAQEQDAGDREPEDGTRGPATRTMRSGEDGYLRFSEEGSAEIVVLLPTSMDPETPIVYTLTETAPPAGYLPLEGEVHIAVSFDGTVEYTEGPDWTLSDRDENGVYTLTIRNKPGDVELEVTIPETGGPGSAALTALGLLLSAGAALLLLIRHKRCG
nr:LPXTG cell wall anchor domain-containing protein [Oscillospiraceae bacterium]